MRPIKAGFDMTHRHYRAAARVPCPRCGARVGETCVTRSGLPYMGGHQVHAPRMYAYYTAEGAYVGMRYPDAPDDACTHPSRIDSVPDEQSRSTGGGLCDA